jgi:hypothetical protein
MEYSFRKPNDLRLLQWYLMHITNYLAQFL